MTIIATEGKVLINGSGTDAMHLMRFLKPKRPSQVSSKWPHGFQFVKGLVACFALCLWIALLYERSVTLSSVARCVSKLVSLSGRQRATTYDDDKTTASSRGPRRQQILCVCVCVFCVNKCVSLSGRRSTTRQQIEQRTTTTERRVAYDGVRRQRRQKETSFV